MAWVETISKDDLNQQRITKVTMADGHKIALIHMDDGVYAIDDTCSHAEASLSEGEVVGDHVKCPLHGAEFDVRTGEVKSFPAVVGVAKYDTKTENDMIYVKYGD